MIVYSLVSEVAEFTAVDVNVKLSVTPDPNELYVPVGELEAMDCGVSKESA